MRSNFFDAAELEIYKYMPPSLLQGDIKELEFDEFLKLFARAKYLQEVEEMIHAKAISRVFGEEE